MELWMHSSGQHFGDRMDLSADQDVIFVNKISSFRHD